MTAWTLGDKPVVVIGGGIGGLTLALELQAAGVPFRIFEAAPGIEAIGVGINILPHASQQLARLGLEDELVATGVATRTAAFYTRFGQFIYAEPLGRDAGYPHPQISIHRGDLQTVLGTALIDRGAQLECSMTCVGLDQDDGGVTVTFDGPSGTETVRGSVAIACDGIHSFVRRQLHPDEGPPRYSGVNMWRGVASSAPVLDGATMLRAGWLSVGKLVCYPIRERIDDDGRQLVNWVAEIETVHHAERDWNREGSVGDFFDTFADWHFDWLDVPALLASSDSVLEYPMVDQDPLDRWSFGRVTLLGDAAHPMVPRGSNGAGQAILDARALCDALVAHRDDPVTALRAYEDVRLDATSRVVLTNRVSPPDAILQVAFERSGDRPYERIEDLVAIEDLRAITDRYKAVAGYTLEELTALSRADRPAV